MINKKTIISVLAGIVLVFAFIFALPPVRAMEDSQVGSMVMKACTACHSTEKICKKLGRKDQLWWNKTVDRMIKHGADITDEQKDLIIQYLAELGAGSEPVCN